MSDFDTVKKEVSDVILDVDMSLDDITAKAILSSRMPYLNALEVQDLKSPLVH